MEKCECYIHSLKQGETHVLGEATILKRIGDNDYLAEYNGVKCHAIFNPFVSACRAEIPADRRAEHRPPHRHTEDQCVSHPHH